MSKTVDVTFDTLFHIPHFSFLIPHPSPIGQRLPDCYPPLDGRGLSSRPISSGGLLQCDKKKNSTPSIKKSGTSQVSTDRMLASVGIPGVSTRDLAESGFPYVSCWAFESGLDRGMPNLTASPFCLAILADSEPEAASMSCFR